MLEWSAILHMDGWAGRRSYPVTVTGETPKRYRVRGEVVSFRLPSGRIVRPGDVVLVPKASIERDESVKEPSEGK